MELRIFKLATFAALLWFYDFTTSTTIPATGPVPIQITSGGEAFVNNNAVLVGDTNTTLTPITASTSGVTLSWQPLKHHVIKVEVSSNYSFTGA